MTDLIEELHRLYADASKHSSYQSVPDFVADALGYHETIDQRWRGDRPRLAYLVERVQPRPGDRWVDFGANTGFFTLTLAHRYPDSQFTAIEANPNHAGFMRRVVEHFGLANVEVLEAAIGLRELGRTPRAGFVLHLNVLHHAGTDFDAELVASPEAFSPYAVRYLSELRSRAERMLFQLGSNWGGNNRRPLVERAAHAAKLRMFSGWLVAAGWRIESVAYPEPGDDGAVRYQDVAFGKEPPAAWLRRPDDELQVAIAARGLGSLPGEFYLRPLFLCRSE